MLGMDIDKVLRGPPAQFHNFKEITPSGVIGDARRANADKGKKLLGVCAEGLAAVLKNGKMWG
jgi:creatinine amidohydrolase